MKGTASRSRWEIISSHIFTYFNFLNLVLAGLILVSGQYKNMLFMGIVITNAVIGIGQELKVKRIIDALSVVTATKARRYKNGEFCKCDIELLQEGDTVQFLLGDQIPVDCEILETDGMEVNESLLTGESLAVQKRKGDFVYSGSDVVAGSAVAKVLHTGEENYATQLVKKAKTKRRATSEMQDAIGKIIKYVSYALIPIGLLLFFIQRYSAGNTLSDSIVNMVAGVIGMIPEDSSFLPVFRLFSAWAVWQRKMHWCRKWKPSKRLREWMFYASIRRGPSRQEICRWKNLCRCPKKKT